MWADSILPDSRWLISNWISFPRHPEPHIRLTLSFRRPGLFHWLNLSSQTAGSAWWAVSVLSDGQAHKIRCVYFSCRPDWYDFSFVFLCLSLSSCVLLFCLPRLGRTNVGSLFSWISIGFLTIFIYFNVYIYMYMFYGFVLIVGYPSIERGVVSWSILRLAAQLLLY